MGRPLLAWDWEQELNTRREGNELWEAVWSMGCCSADIGCEHGDTNMRCACHVPYFTHGKDMKWISIFNQKILSPWNLLFWWTLDPWSWRWHFRNVGYHLPIEPQRRPRRSEWSVCGVFLVCNLVTVHFGIRGKNGSSVPEWELYSGRHSMYKRTWDTGFVEVMN
jgi:hypothetical protein